MALVRETREAQIDTFLNAVRDRGSVSRISTSAEMLKDPKLVYRDDDIGAFYIFENRGTFFEWSYGAATSQASQAQLEALLTQVFLDAASEFDESLPYSWFYNEACPTFMEFTDNGSDLSQVDDIVLASNAIRLGSAIRLDPAQELSFSLNNGGTLSLGKVYAHSVPLRIDNRG